MKISELLNEGFKEAKAEFSQVSADADAVIAQYRELVNKNQVSGQEKNIDYWRKQGWEAFNKFVQEISIRPTKTIVKRKKAEGKSIIVEENSEWLIVIPIDHNASCFYGRQTSWCTAKPEQPYFKAYTNKGVMLIYCLRSDGTKWAIAVGDDDIEFFDQDDTNLDQESFETETRLNVLDVIAKAKNTPEWKAKAALGSILKDRRDKLANENLNVLPRDVELEKKLLDTADVGLISQYFRTIDSRAINEVGPEFRLLALLGNHYLLQKLINVSEYEKGVLIKDDWRAIQYIKNPSHEIQELALPQLEKTHGSFKTFLPYCGYDSSPKVQMAGIKQDYNNIMYIYNPTKEMKDYIQKHYPYLVDEIHDPRDYLTHRIQDRSGLLQAAYERREAAINELERFEQGIKDIPPELLTAESKPLLQGLLDQKTEAVNDAKLLYDKFDQEIKGYQAELAKLPVQESAELARILYLSSM
jgi:hypothetical protein